MTSTQPPAVTPERQPADEFERRYGRLGGREQRILPLTIEEIRDSGAGAGQFTVRGHAAVFDMWSLDLGWFRERIDPAAFDSVLARNPDTWLLWDHDTRWTLARTHNKTLELRTDPRGLHYWGRVAPTSYADDLRILMERGDIDQASFAFTVARDHWEYDTDENGDIVQISRTILEVAELYDVTITAMGAYPQTDSQVVRERFLTYASSTGRLPEELAGAVTAAQDSPAGGEPSEPRQPAGDEAGARNKRLATLRARSRSRLAQMG